MDNVREYGNVPYKYLVLHGGPGAPGCAAGLCRGLSKKAGVLEHLQKSHTIEGLFDEIKYLKAVTLEDVQKKLSQLNCDNTVLSVINPKN